ncbi:unnamed protein product [Ranitomeya imitator]|uniref:protein disulfide-isomerase n=1 Tax=Ranitomeya imitator TaxID=111125 RepID=A0ABN9LZV2_9NEOB|nr:unnamed protein product [Ranitomeya imitator]
MRSSVGVPEMERNFRGTVLEAKRTGKSKHKQCAICTEPLPDSYLKSLCQACIDNTLRQEESVKMNEIRLIIREELQSLGGGSTSSVNMEKRRRKTSSPRADTSAESGEVDSDISQQSNSSEEEDFVCFPTEGINNLVKSVRNTMGVSESKEPQTPQEVMFAGLSQKKGHVFPINQAIKDLVKKEWSRGEKGLVPISCKRRYPFDDEDLNTWAKIPKVDAAVASTSRRFSLPVEDAVGAVVANRKYRITYRDFQFGHMDGNDYINSLLMDEVQVPTIVVLNTSNQQYFLPNKKIENTEDLIQFINSILDGTAEAQGGDGILQRIKRVAYDAKSTVVSVFKSSPLLGCFLFGLPLGVISIMCYGICTADSDDGSEEMTRKDVIDPNVSDEGSDEEQDEDRTRENSSEVTDEDQEEKDIMEKKKD